MRCLDPGHVYDLAVYDGLGASRLTFMKREGDGYPGNVGHHPGTNCQEVIRVLIDRVLYLDGQVPAEENLMILAGLRGALLAFELRAARRHGRSFLDLSEPIETLPTCVTCGHIACAGHGVSA